MCENEAEEFSKVVCLPSLKEVHKRKLFQNSLPWNSLSSPAILTINDSGNEIRQLIV